MNSSVVSANSVKISVETLVETPEVIPKFRRSSRSSSISTISVKPILKITTNKNNKTNNFNNIDSDDISDSYHPSLSFNDDNEENLSDPPDPSNSPDSFAHSSAPSTPTINSSFVPLSEKSSLIVHNGLDGIAAAIVAIIYGFDGDIYAVTAQGISVETMIRPYKDSIIVDLCLPRDSLMKEMRNNDISVYDHHGRNSYIGSLYKCKFDPRRCASQTYYEFEYALYLERMKSVELFLHLVDLIDRWQVDSPDFDEAVSLLHLFNSSTEVKINEINKINETNEISEINKNSNSISFIPSTSSTSSTLIYRSCEILPGRFEDFLSRITFKLMFIHDDNIESLPYSIEERSMIDDEYRKFYEDVKKTKKTLDARIDSLMRGFAFCRIYGNVSLVLATLLKEYEGLSYIIAYEYYGKYARLYGRSRSIDVDLNGIEYLEGHPTAAGGMIGYQELQKILRNKSLSLNVHDVDISKRRERGVTPHEMKLRCDRINKSKLNNTNNNKNTYKNKNGKGYNKKY